jgi:hypothetical protein
MSVTGHRTMDEIERYGREFGRSASWGVRSSRAHIPRLRHQIAQHRRNALSDGNTNARAACHQMTASVFRRFKLSEFKSLIPSVLSIMEEENHFCTATTVARTFMSPTEFAAMADVPRLPSAINTASGAMGWSSKHGGTAV